jgi:hypothetical protein
MTINTHPYFGVTAALATKHQKEKILSPVFERLNISIAHAEVDTDQLGTFSGEIPRLGSPRETVIKKARMGMELKGLQYGVASEGSIGTDSNLIFLNSDVELLAWIDGKNGIEIVESLKSFEIFAQSGSFKKDDSYIDFLEKIDFPNHAVIVRGDTSGSPIHKGINDLAKLNTLIKEIFKDSQSVVIENDLRAHFSPSRRLNIERLGNKLIDRLASLCKKCNLPGWGAIDYIYGLPCHDCGEVNSEAVSGKIFGCCKCDYREEIYGDKKSITAAECFLCNP